MRGTPMVKPMLIVSRIMLRISPERDAMGDDEYHPLSHKGSNLASAGGIGYFVVDSIDTMLLMGLNREHERAKKWVSTELTFERDGHFNTFEVCDVSFQWLCRSGWFLDNYPCSRRASLSLPPFQ
jgi:hypothetical protein